MRAATDDGLEQVNTEVDFVARIKKLAVKSENRLVAQVKFLGTGQDRG